jgi:probable HAF family extracellular repeat protein
VHHTYEEAFMKVEATLLLAAVGLAGCRDATQPLGHSSALPPQFSIVTSVTTTDLGTLGGRSEADAINDLGQVAGFSTDPEHPFLWTAADGLLDLGVDGDGLGINDLGQVVGVMASSPPGGHAFLGTAAAGITDLGTLGGCCSRGFGINDLGQIVGSSNLADRPFLEFRAFLRSPDGTMLDLGTLGGEVSEAFGINNLGQVVGDGSIAGAIHAFLWTAAGGMRDLGTLGGSLSRAFDVNDLGQVVGYSTTASGELHLFLWTADAGMTDLGTLGPLPSGDVNDLSINDLGQIAGREASGSGEEHAFVWTEEGGRVDLNGLGGCCSAARGINDVGQVVGWASPAVGEPHAVLWTLELTPPTAVEEISVLTAGVGNAAASGAINNGQHTALLAKLDAATRAINRGNTRAAINILRAFINQVQSYIDAGTLTLAEGQPLIDAAQRLISELGG